MEREHLLILDLIETGKISVPEALELLDAVDENANKKENSDADPYENTITIQLYLNQRSFDPFTNPQKKIHTL